MRVFHPAIQQRRISVWIAALALQYGLMLVTRDAHFQEVEDRQIVMLLCGDGREI